MRDAPDMEAALPPRRVVTGLDLDGRSCVQIDGPAQMVIWRADALPADNDEELDRGGGRFRFPVDGVDFVCADFPPGGASPMHASDTLDFLVVVFGEITFITETGETALRAGDVLVDRGALHGWRNDSSRPCGSAQLEWAPMSGAAKLVSWCIFHYDYYGGALPTPYEAILVELAEGPHFVSNPKGFSGASAPIGTVLKLAFLPCEDVGGRFLLPVFEKA